MRYENGGGYWELNTNSSTGTGVCVYGIRGFKIACLALLYRLSVHSDLSDPAVSKMLVNIWNIALKGNAVSPDLMVRHN